MVTKDNYFRVILNYVFLASGPTLVIVSVYILFYYLKFKNFIDPIVWRMPIAFLILGILTIFLTMFACCGLATNYGLTSLIYFLLTILLIGLEIGLGAYWVHIQPDYPATMATKPPKHNVTKSPTGTPSNSTANATTVKTFFETSFRFNLEDENVTKKVMSAVMVDFGAYDRNEDLRSFQLQFRCCGINGAQDFIDRGMGVPPECCRKKTKAKNGTKEARCKLKKSAQKGCLEVLLVRLYVDRLVLGTVSIVAGSVTLILLVTSFFIRYEDEGMYDDRYDDEMEQCCPQNECRRQSQMAQEPIIPRLVQICPMPVQQSQPPSPPCCRKYPPCQCAPKLRQC